MKSCNNCGTVNLLTVEKCVHCNMAHQFTFHEEPAEAPRAEQKQELQCANCGSNQPGEEELCQHCRFPLPGKVLKSIKTANLLARPNHKTG